MRVEAAISYNLGRSTGNSTTTVHPIDLIKQFGFTRSGSCSCGGTRNEVYKKDTYILYYRKTRHVFKIKKKNETIIPITSLSKLEAELKILFPDVAVAE